MTIPGPAGPSRPAPRPQRPAADLYGLDEDIPAAPHADEVLISRSKGARRGAAPSGGVPVWVWLAAGGVGLLVLVLVCALLLRRPAAPQVAQGGEENTASAPAAGVPTAPAQPDPGFQADRTSAAPAQPAWRVQVDPAPPAQPAWRVQVDPAPEKLEFPPIAKLAISVPEAYGNNDVLYPTTPSPFVMMGGNEVDDHYREVWDLRGPKRMGRLAGRIETAKPMALSPDGEYFATHTNPVPRTTDIWRVSDATRIGRIADGENIPDVVDFAGPGRLLIGTSYAKQFQVWDFTSGKVVTKIAVPATWGVDRESVALSPGRRFMALAYAQGNKVQVFDLTTGRSVGEAPLEKEGNANFDCQALAFSPDGTALGGLFTAGSTSTHVMCWDVATGRLEADFRAEGRDPYGKLFSYEGQPLQWLPDQSGWMVYDQAIVERKSGQTVWNLPFDKGRNMVEGPRRLLDAERLVTLVKVRERKTLQLVSLPKDKIQAALGIAKGGGSAVDATLPPATTADRSAAKLVASPSEPAKWAVGPDAAPAPKAKAGKAIALKASALDLVGLLVSAPAAQALVTSSPGARLSTTAKKGEQGQTPRQVERYDLAAGRLLGRYEVPAIALPLALSADGAQVLLAYATAPDRLDVHSATDGKHVAGWRPYEAESGDDRNVVWADFLSAGRVLTVNAAGTLILWSLPACKAEYVAEQAVQGVPVLSHGRKSLAVIRGASLRFLDPATGSPQGDAPASGHQTDRGLIAAAFRPDGKELAAVLDASIVRWDLATGQVVGEAPCPVPNAMSLQYAGKGHVLIDGKALFDLGEKRAVWYYQGGLHSSASPDGAHWIAAGPITGAATLRGIELPDKTIARAEEAAADPKTKSMLRAGVSVGIQVTANPPRDANGFRAEVVKGLSGRLQEIGAQVAEGQPIQIVASFQEKDTGQTIELRQLGSNAPNVPVRHIPARNVEWSLAVADGQGEPVVFARDAIGVRGFSITHLPPGESDVEGYLRQQQWRQAAAQAIARGLPYFMARRPGGAVILPGLTNLGHPQF
ncbi:MAG: hypothetical protein P4L84_18990 [Isosphaeraceae bacterium]|nr:hypothetical protein [Isosphaeraceae bacterium]